MDPLSLLLALSLVVTPIYSIRVTLHGIPIYLPEIFILLAALYWLILLITRKTRIFWPPLLAVVTILIFLFGATLSAHHAHLSSAYGALKSWVILPIIFAFLVYQALSNRPKSRYYLEIGLLVSAVVVSLYGIIGLLLHGGRLESFFNSPNSAAMWLVPVFFILLPRRRIKLFLLTLVIILIGIVLTWSFSSMVGLALGWLAMGVVAKIQKPAQEKIAWVVPIIAVAVFAYVSLTTWLSTVLSNTFGSRLGGRLQIWNIGRLAVHQNLLYGIGPDVFQRYYFARVGLLFPNPIEWSVPEPHNLYLATWISSGLIGFVGFFSLVFALFYQQVQSKQPALFGALVAIMVNGLTDTPYWKNDLSIIFFLIVALSFVTISPKKNSTSESIN